MPKARVNNVSLYYEAEGTGRPLVLVHGHTLNLRMWDSQVPSLTRDHRVIRYDMRGHGRSESPATGYALPIYAEDHAALLSYVGVARAGIVGMSIGGGIALEFALRYQERVDYLVLVSSMLDGYAFSDEWNRFWKPFAQVIRTDGPRAAIEAMWLDHPMFGTLRRSPTKFYVFRDLVLNYAGGEYLATQPTRLVPTRRQIERLGEILVPVLIVSGEHDIPDMLGVARTLAAGLPRAEHRIIADAGHMVNIEQPGAFNAALREFLTKVEKAKVSEQTQDG